MCLAEILGLMGCMLVSSTNCSPIEVLHPEFIIWSIALTICDLILMIVAIIKYRQLKSTNQWSELPVVIQYE